MNGTRSTFVAALLGTALTLTGCGGDSGEAAPTAEAAEDAAGTEPTDTGEASATESAVEDGAGADAAGGPSGTVTIDGTAHEVSGSEFSFRMVDGKMERVETGGAFEVCTYQDGGNEGQVTIFVNLSEDEFFYINFGRPDGIPPSADYPSAAQSTEAVDARLDGDRAIGTADFTADGGPLIEFEFRCA